MEREDVSISSENHRFPQPESSQWFAYACVAVSISSENHRFPQPAPWTLECWCEMFQSHPRTTASLNGVSQGQQGREKNVSISSENHRFPQRQWRRAWRRRDRCFNLIREPPLPSTLMFHWRSAKTSFMFQSHPRTTASLNRLFRRR